MNNFIKKNFNDNDCLLKEANDLKLLQKYLDKSYINIPELKVSTKHELQLERILKEKPSIKHMQNLGTGLAKLHKIKFENYGASEDNFIGLNLQKNVLSDNWGAFFVEHRLDFQVEMIKTNSIKEEFQEILLNKRNKLVEFLNLTCEHPSLVHGDLWSGNVIFDEKGVWLIDPSSYYAHREVDIAMTEMFLGFSQEFYEAYNKEYNLSENYEKNKIVYNLYHYLNHYNLYGNTYLAECQKAFEFIRKL